VTTTLTTERPVLKNPGFTAFIIGRVDLFAGWLCLIVRVVMKPRRRADARYRKASAPKRDVILKVSGR
jgi:hypothetical protein